MWQRKQLKKAAKNSIRKNYIAAVAVCFIIAFLAGGYSYSTGAIRQNNNSSGYVEGQLLNVFEKVIPKNGEKYRGVFGSFVNAIVHFSVFMCLLFIFPKCA